MQPVSEPLIADPLEQCFSLSVDLPLRVQIMPNKIAAYDLERINILNNTLLDIVLSQSEVPMETPDVDETLLRQLKLTEAKVDLALLWLSRLVFPDTQIPVAQKLQLNTFGLRFHETQAFTQGEYLQIQLFVDGALAEPIRLEAEVHSLEHEVVTARFIGMMESVRDKLEKYIFRSHRRAIANKRQQ